MRESSQRKRKKRRKKKRKRMRRKKKKRKRRTRKKRRKQRKKRRWNNPRRKSQNQVRRSLFIRSKLRIQFSIVCCLSYANMNAVFLFYDRIYNMVWQKKRCTD